MGVATSNLGDN